MKLLERLLAVAAVGILLVFVGFCCLGPFNGKPVADPPGWAIEGPGGVELCKACLMYLERPDRQAMLVRLEAIGATFPGTAASVEAGKLRSEMRLHPEKDFFSEVRIIGSRCARGELQRQGK